MTWAFMGLGIVIISLTIKLVLGAFATLRKTTVSFVMSVRPHGATLLQFEGFDFNKI